MSETTVHASETAVSKSAGHAENRDTMRMGQEEFNAYYRLNPKVKQKPELREQDILLSVRHLKQHFTMGKGAQKQRLKAEIGRAHV